MLYISLLKWKIIIALRLLPSTSQKTLHLLLSTSHIPANLTQFITWLTFDKTLNMSLIMALSLFLHITILIFHSNASFSPKQNLITFFCCSVGGLYVRWSFRMAKPVCPAHTTKARLNAIKVLFFSSVTKKRTSS